MQVRFVPSVASAAALLAMGWGAVRYAERVPDPVPALAPADVFSAERAMHHVRRIAQRPHHSGSEDHTRVRAYIVGQLRALGIPSQVHEATGVGTRYAVAGRVRNILARLPGQEPGGPSMLLMAHYDGAPAGPAAGDDGAGSAVVLETLRALSAGNQLRHDVIALFADGEEAGLVGAAAFVREHPWAKDAAVILNFEARGTRGPSFMFETGPGNLDVVRELRHLGDARATSLSVTVYRTLPNDTDLSELAVLQRPAMNFAFIGGANRYHTAQDDVAHLDPSSVQHHGNQALALARTFANGPLPRPRTSDAVFSNVPLLGVIVHPEGWSVPIALLALVLVAAAIMLPRRRETHTVRSVLLGALGSVAAALITGVVGIGVSIALRQLHGAIGSGTPHWSGVYAAGAALLAFSVATASYALLRRWASAAGAHAGGLFSWAAIGLITAALAPGVNFIFTWPVLVIAVATLASAARPGARLTPVVLWTATLVAVFIVMPTVYTMACVALGLDESGVAVLSVFTALGAWLLAPHVETMGAGAGRPWSVPAASAAVALLLFAVGAVTIRTDAEHPSGASFVYAVDADSNKAWLAGYASGGSGPWLRRAFQGMGAASDSNLPAWMRRSFDPERVISAPLAVPAPAPATATVLGDSMIAAERRLTLRIRPSRGTRSIAMQLEEDADVSFAEVDGRRVETSRYRGAPRRWRLSYAAPADSGFTLSLSVPATASLVLGLSSRHDGIPPLPDFAVPKRPPGIIPWQGGDMVLVYKRLRL